MQKDRIIIAAAQDLAKQITSLGKSQSFEGVRVDTLEQLINRARKRDYDYYFIDYRLLAARKSIKELLRKNAEIFERSVLLVDSSEQKKLSRAKEVWFFDYLTLPVEPARFVATLRRLREITLLRKKRAEQDKNLAILNKRGLELNKVGIALSTEHNLQTLLEMILSETRGFTLADAGSLYIKEDMDPEQITADDRKDALVETGKQLRFVHAQNDSIDTPFKEFTMKVSKKSIAGYVAMTGQVLCIKDAYHMPKNSDYTFNTDFDKSIGYRSTSMLVVPMKNRKDEIIGVVQLINCKKDRREMLLDPETTPDKVQPFDEQIIELVESLASQAAVAIENAQLYKDIRGLLDSYIDASMAAIEVRDKTTFGHASRVARYTIALCEQINKTRSGPLARVEFDEEAMRLMYYAASLHDMGKISVPDNVLQKENKLTDDQLAAISNRIDYAIERAKSDFLAEQLKIFGNDKLKAATKEDKIERLKLKLEKEVELLDDYREFIVQNNRPGFLSPDKAEKLDKIKIHKYTSPENRKKNLLTNEEFDNLAVVRGNLTAEERFSMNHHIVDTWEILTRIRWPKNMTEVPLIASTHHEKLDGSGYPWGMKGKQIPLGGQIIALVDFFEALTARDRPYKPPLPIDKSIDIIGADVKRGLLNEEIWKIFVDKKVWKGIADEIPSQLSRISKGHKGRSGRLAALPHGMVVE